jgi:hypothetical protein
MYVQAITWLPALTALTSLRTASTVPAGSWPRMAGMRAGKRTMDAMELAMTNAAGNNTYQRLAWPGFVDFDFLYT